MIKYFIAILLGLGGAIYCAIGEGTMNSATALTITGPGALAPDTSGSYTVKVAFERKVDHTMTLEVKVWEDDVGNELLDDLVRIQVLSGSKEGEASFPVHMNGDCELEGRSGATDAEDEHEVFAEIVGIVPFHDGTVPPLIDAVITSDNHPIKCE